MRPTSLQPSDAPVNENASAAAAAVAAALAHHVATPASCISPASISGSITSRNECQYRKRVQQTPLDTTSENDRRGGWRWKKGRIWRLGRTLTTFLGWRDVFLDLRAAS